jgi:hypothetical protein
VADVSISASTTFGPYPVARAKHPCAHLQFSPLKNAPGAADGTPQHCVEDLFSLHKRFVVLSGGEFADENSAVEISPLVCGTAAHFLW